MLTALTLIKMFTMSTSKQNKLDDAYHHGNLREALMTAATEILEEEGITKLSLRGVARRAGVSQTAPYRHFKDKSALLAAVAASGFRGLAQAMRDGAARQTSPSDQLAEIGQSYVRFAVANSAVFHLMFGPEITDKSSDPDLCEAADEAFAALASTAALSTGKSDSETHRGKIDGAPDQAFAAWSMVHGLATLLIDNQIKPEMVFGGESDPIELTRRFGRFFDFSRP